MVSSVRGTSSCNGQTQLSLPRKVEIRTAPPEPEGEGSMVAAGIHLEPGGLVEGAQNLGEEAAAVVKALLGEQAA
jgi:hypothetical protein